MVLTPCTRSMAFSDLLACSLWLKFETRQRTGSFKLRGATNKILTLPDGVPAVVTASSGNHGMAVASAARQLDLPARVYVPEGSAATKCAAMAQLGADVVIFGADFVDAEAESQRDAARTGLRTCRRTTIRT